MPFSTDFFQPASVPHLVEGTRHVQGIHNGVQAFIKGVLSFFGEEH